MKILKQYIPTGARHKLLFTSHHAEGMNFVDIGALLARAIESSLSNRHLSFVAEEELEKITKACTNEIIIEVLSEILGLE